MSIQSEINRCLDCKIPVPLNLQLSHYKEVINCCEAKGISIPNGAYRKQLWKTKINSISLLFSIIYLGIFIAIPFIFSLDFVGILGLLIIMSLLGYFITKWILFYYLTKKEQKFDELVYNELQPNINWQELEKN